MSNDTQCHLLSGSFSIILQVFLGTTALCTLAYKRFLEKPRRPVSIWMYDASKQGIGAGMGHILNMMLSIWYIQIEVISNGDECAMYFINFSTDIFIGTFIIYGLIMLKLWVAKVLEIPSLYNTGFYGSPPSFKIYFVQLLAFLLALILAKVILVGLVLLIYGPINSTANFIFMPLKDFPDLELFLVMILIPWVLNAGQFWILDNLVMNKFKHEETYKLIEEFP
mmetsp:Transcript_20006/g.29594  ORF Transcript_20006/g.29594 Transcript_20006/m.29594 type:complete len:224 (+) Transcript_20006:93-764(+)|eukprot:CAMPEP_0171452114 /NCGR_PEP_ID=MMETSP0945-20130129/347_1 /TAXON_ID=109269 /ORGANISM="Vaucheria litorea, Strain CCMP2940" /LENGTH=223 /DNA_ID=CAMNT_0011976707 /DNA_START=83 /DNA_END=754 /DNA_ORIENTATION=+